MLKMLKLRTDIKKNINNLINDVNSLNDLPSSMTDHQKLYMLTEQLVFAKYLLTIAPSNSMYVTFKDACILAIHNLPQTTNGKEDNQEYINFKYILNQVISNFNYNEYWIQLSTILDDNKHGVECKQLPVDFYQPFLHSLSNTFPKSKTSTTPVLLYPYLYKDIGGIYVSYTTEVFTSFNYENKYKHEDNQNPIFKYLSQFNWNGKQFGHVIQVLSNLHMDLGNHEQDITTVIEKGLSSGHIDKIKNVKPKITQLMNFVHRLSTTYGMPLSDTRRVGDFLSRFDGFDPEAIEYLMVQEPSMYMKNKFNKIPELKFLSYIVEDRCNKTIYGKEDAGKEEDKIPDDSEAISDEDDFSIEDENKTDDMSENTDVSSTDETDTSVDESEDMTDTSSSTESSEADVANNETDTTSEDPTIIPYNVMIADPSTETIMYRHRVANALRKLIKNPPSDISTSTTTALKMWLTQWLYIVSPSTTRRFLTLLLNNQSMISKV